MARLLDADDLIAELEAACMPIYEGGLSGIPGSTDTIADIIYERANIFNEIQKNEPAPAATGTSSEVSDDTNFKVHLDDSTLLDICQEGLEEISKIALDDYPNEFLTGYVCAARNNIKRLRGGEGNG